MSTISSAPSTPKRMSTWKKVVLGLVLSEAVIGLALVAHEMWGARDVLSLLGS